MPELDIKCNVEGGKFHYTEDGIIIAPIGLVFTLNIPIDFKFTLGAISLWESTTSVGIKRSINRLKW